MPEMHKITFISAIRKLRAVYRKCKEMTEAVCEKQLMESTLLERLNDDDDDDISFQEHFQDSGKLD